MWPVLVHIVLSILANSWIFYLLFANLVKSISTLLLNLTSSYVFEKLELIDSVLLTDGQNILSRPPHRNRAFVS
jgi:hypothetical protein